MKTIIKSLKIIAFTLVCFGQLDAAPYSSSSRSFSSSSSSRSSSSSPSRSFSSSSSSYSAPKASPPKSSSYGAKSTSSSSFGSSSSSYKTPTVSSPETKSSIWKSNTQTSTRLQSNVESNRYANAAKTGKVFQTRESAINDFKKSKAATYTNSYVTEPTKRPDYIPPTYRSKDGRSYNVTFNQSYGGYGYWNGGGPGLGTFLLYDMMQDQAMLNLQMSRNNYYVGNPPPAQYYDVDDDTIAENVASIFLGVVVGLSIFVIIIAAIVKMV
jgi:hypothetical protein